MGRTDYAGIDYGMGRSNKDPETGIRYGVIHANDVEWWHEESEAYYPECEECENPDECECEMEVSSWYVDTDYLKAEQSGDDCDIFIIKSRYFTYCQFCSPCAPGAGYLTSYTNPEDGGPRAYCFGPDWFGDHVPYPIYSVETGELVKQATDETLPIREA